LRGLAERFAGEIPELTIRRPSLEDVYLSMIGMSEIGMSEIGNAEIGNAEIGSKR
jgi:ABC-2 type transport system ATP-binding protein